MLELWLDIWLKPSGFWGGTPWAGRFSSLDTPVIKRCEYLSHGLGQWCEPSCDKEALVLSYLLLGG